jgi:hypothetical protein
MRTAWADVERLFMAALTMTRLKWLAVIYLVFFPLVDMSLSMFTFTQVGAISMELVVHQG